MLNYKIGNLLDASDEVIAHSCNICGAFGAGVAKAIAEKYPIMKDKYIRSYKNDQLILGNIQCITFKDKVIANLYAQPTYGKTGLHIDYRAFSLCFEKLLYWMYLNGYNTLGIPKIGAGLGGGDFNTIVDIIESKLNLTLYEKIGVTVYSLE